MASFLRTACAPERPPRRPPPATPPKQPGQAQLWARCLCGPRDLGQFLQKAPDGLHSLWKFTTEGRPSQRLETERCLQYPNSAGILNSAERLSISPGDFLEKQAGHPIPGRSVPVIDTRTNSPVKPPNGPRRGPKPLQGRLAREHPILLTSEAGYAYSACRYHRKRSSGGV